MPHYPRLRHLREDNDYTQVYVAQYLHISQPGYSKYESGANDLPTDVLIQLARLYNTSVDYLLGVCDNPDRYE